MLLFTPNICIIHYFLPYYLLLVFNNIGTDPKISTLTPNGHLDLPPALIHGETMTFALGSRKNSVISLGRANLDQKAVVSANVSL